MPEVRTLTHRDVNFRIGIAAALRVLKHYHHRTESRLNADWSAQRIRDLSSECERLGLLLRNKDQYVSTPMGVDLLESEGKPSFSENARKCFETCDPRFRYVWAAVCEKADKNGRFAKRQVTELFMHISKLSNHPFQKGTADIYAATFLGWAKAAGVCESEKYGVYRVKSRYDLLFQLPTGQQKTGKTQRLNLSEKDAGADFEVPLLRLNALISDIMANENDEEDLKRIDDLLKSLRGMGVINELAIDFLDDAIKAATSSQDFALRKLVGKLLKRLRTHYIEKPQSKLSEFSVSERELHREEL